ncbi:MAG: PorT family protein [Reichenbachiella sp.]
MTKTLTLIALLLITSFSYAQPKIGLTVSPGFSMSRVKYDSDTGENIKDGDPAFRVKFGLEFDFPLTENYAFSTGLIFAPKRATIQASSFNQATSEIVNQTEEYKVQYLQIPLSLKLFTSEIQPDLKLYFQLGFTGEILLYNEPLDQDYVLVEDFRFFDFSFTGGAGVEYGAGVNSTLYAGVFYDRGLVNIVSEQHPDINNDLAVFMDNISLRVGIKF